MVLDSSAIIAILRGEPDADRFLSRMADAGIRLISAATAVEASIVILARHKEAGLSLYREMVAHLTIETVPLQASHVDIAVDAFARYGKGRHPAALNLGDCFSYALAKATDQPLLFKGDDFVRTDIKRAI